jgi:hypothetical protein
LADSYQALLTFAVRPDDGPRTWDDLLDRPMFTQGEHSITFREVICRWAEQLGGAHEDWTVDETLLKTHTAAYIDRPNGQRFSLAQSNLTATAVKVIASASQLLSGIEEIERLKSATPKPSPRPATDERNEQPPVTHPRTTRADRPPDAL